MYASYHGAEGLTGIARRVHGHAERIAAGLGDAVVHHTFFDTVLAAVPGRADEVVAAVDRGGVDLCVLDGEAQPTGGMGISRQLKNEIADCPQLVVLIARQADRWLAHWSLADATLAYPIDPLTATDVVAGLLRARALQRPAVRR